jgi:hypothetical protein
MGKKHRWRPEDYIEQDSTFLSLPREIRDHIYHFCLTKPGAIDLWPDKYLKDTDIREIPALEKRSGGIFRHQHDLEYVRRQLAVGLLATGMQVYDETWPHFYRANQFRVSMDSECTGLRRFLTTIGERNRAQLKNIWFCAAAVASLRQIEPGARSDPANFGQGVKNHPKLHMSKLHMRPARPSGYGNQNFRFIVELLLQENPPLLRNLRLTIPPGWKLGDSWLPWNIDVSDFNDNLATVMTKLPWLNLIIIVQERAALVDELDREWLRRQGVTTL